MIIYVDIDGTICKEKILEDGTKDYKNHTPFYDRINYINSLFDEGHEIHYWTARGARSGIDWTDLTEEQLDTWKCKYTSLTVGKKPHYDIMICDKAFNSDAWFTHQSINSGIEGTSKYLMKGTQGDNRISKMEEKVKELEERMNRTEMTNSHDVQLLYQKFKDATSSAKDINELNKYLNALQVNMQDLVQQVIDIRMEMRKNAN